MKTDKINRLVRDFLHGDMPEEIQRRFRRWMTAPADRETKDAALFQAWKELLARPAERDYRHKLPDIHHRIDMLDRAGKKSRFISLRRFAAAAALLALVIGLVLGSVAALCRGRWPDRVIIFVTTLFVSVPSFILATILLLVFCLQLQWVGVWSPSNPNYVLPVIALALYPMAYITRLTKSSMLDVLGQDYIRTARAKGVHEWLVIFKHALRNALIPVITYVGPMTAYILTGSMVVETVFTVGGLGTKFVSSINNQDYPMIMAVTIFLAVLMVVATLLSDLIYKAVDPRIQRD